MMENAGLTAQQNAFLRAIASGPRPIPTVWPKWLTDLWIRDYVSTRGTAFVLRPKGETELERALAAEAPTRHEILIVVSASAADRARGLKDEVLAAMAQSHPDIDVTLVTAEGDLVDGAYMVLPCRGSTGAGGLRPMPPHEIVDGVIDVLQGMAFLEALTLQ